MSNDQVVKKAFAEAEKELADSKVAELKQCVKDTLTAIEQSKEVVKQEQEKQRIYKLDLEDLRKGNIKSIEDRQTESPVAKICSHILVHHIYPYQYRGPSWFHDSTSGTYTVSCLSNGLNSTNTTNSAMPITKTIYLN